MEFPEGWDVRKTSFCGEGMDMFHNYTNVS